jgi:3-hydroxyacyl-CoA dehydrogenase
VLLLDIVPPDGKGGSNAFANGAMDKLRKAKPAAFMAQRNAILIKTGNFDDDLAKVADSDIVIEAIIERLDLKQALFTKLEKLVAPHAIVASNTSGLRIADMLQGRSEQFRKNFIVTHFFNPPRYMKLLELVAGPATSAEAKQRVEAWGRNELGKGIVWAKDTPNFVGNRIGVQSMMTVIHTMIEMGLSPEDVDAITGVPMAHPKSATFRTADMVGLDTMGHVATNSYKTLVDDEDRETFKVPPYVEAMIGKGQLGDKTKGGFYKKVGADIQTLDPKTGEYRA